MTIHCESHNDGKNITIAISGCFDFNCVQEFRGVYMALDGKKSSVELDMRQTEYMDSSALGMLLNMKKHLNAADTDIRIVNCQPQVKKILQISRFDKKFTLS
ncbi:MAG TPA: STAS domain-containing protein [Pseudomonadales bacterium]|nr:STAS domain-containing protein [Pseudomonadales bacterium]